MTLPHLALPRPRTVRARLTLFTMLVTGVLLALIIVVVDLGARRTLLGAVDGEMLRQARGMANGRPRGPRGPRGPGDAGPGDFPPGGGFGGGFWEGANGSRPATGDGSATGTVPRSGTVSRSDASLPTPAVGPERGDRAVDDGNATEDVHPLDFSPQPNAQDKRPAYDPAALVRARNGQATFSEREIGASCTGSTRSRSGAAVRSSR